MKKVLLVTRPLVPPWDEASKNFAFSLSCYVKSTAITVLTNSYLSIFPKRINQLAIYSKGSLDISQKLRLIFLRRHLPNFDIIHYLLSPTNTNALFARFFLKNKSVKTIQTVATIQYDRYSKQNLKRILFADLLITYSDFTKKKLEKIGIDSIKRIYPGIDLYQYRAKEVSENFYTETGLTAEDFIVTYPGEYVRLGATDDLVATLPALAKEIPNLKFVFACRIKSKADSLKKQEVMKKIKSMKLDDKVIYTDTIKDMSALYNASDVVVFPVRTMRGKFDVPLIIIEAMACAKPVIVSDLPVLTEFASDNNAIIVGKNNNEQLVSELAKLSKNSELCKGLGLRARNYAVKNFDIIKIAKEYESVYESLV